ncbi:pseudouridine synthase [Pavlovales sp. CCMP2436]|nr:pseudouridine synthase [Pavlovales sp. CCMP2436]|mmetsp:Transcript_12351/g.31206  ORF Transcript_12351/g.31206 Transcript_12351/m.31206 type:complete len:277 (+) Transcript_12351:161-991(+)
MAGAPALVGVRLELLMARLNLCSRKEAHALITGGRVRVNGVCASTLELRRVAEDATVTLRAPAASELLPISVALFKPVSFHSVPGHRNTTAQRQAKDLLVPSNRAPRCHDPTPPLPRLHKMGVAGRLDSDSSGLLIFSQSGAICRHIIGEAGTVEKEYSVHVQSPPDWADAQVEQAIERLGKPGFLLPGDDRPLRPMHVRREGERFLRFVLTEGRHRQIRRMCEAVGLGVEALRRERIGRLTLEELGLRSGQWRLFTPEQLLPRRLTSADEFRTDF